MSPEDLEMEAAPGLPHALPPGERILWQGRPRWTAMATHTFKLKWVAIYFAVLVAARVALAVVEGQGLAAALPVGIMAAVFGACLGLLALLAWLNANASIYTITNRRVVLQIGVALSMNWNFPFKRLTSADLALRADDDGDIVLRMTPPHQARAVYLWPHVEPAGFLKAAPALRHLEEPARVAQLLKDAVTRCAAEEASPLVVTSTREAPASKQTLASNRPSVARPVGIGPKLAAEAGR